MQRLITTLLMFLTFNSFAENDRDYSYLDIGYSYSSSEIIRGINAPIIYNRSGEGFFIESSFQPTDHIFFGAFLDRKEADIWVHTFPISKNTVLAEYGLFTGYQKDINENLNWYGMVRISRFDSGTLGVDKNGIQMGGGLKMSLSDRFSINGGLFLNKFKRDDGTYPTINLEGVYNISDKYHLKLKLQKIDGDLARQFAVGYSF